MAVKKGDRIIEVTVMTGLTVSTIIIVRWDLFEISEVSSDCSLMSSNGE